MKTRKRLCYAATLLALFCLASCAQNDSDDTLLPAGKYPMTFTTSINELVATRASSNNTWEGGEEIALQIGDEVKKYVINVSGDKVTLTSEDPFYWTSRNETVCGWYYGHGYYTDKLLEEWEVDWDQNVYWDQNVDWDQNVASNQIEEYRDGYQESDFLYAPAQEVSFGKDTPLKFYHQTARVVINILNADAATSADQILYFDLYNTCWGRYTAPMQKGVTVGTWEVTELDVWSITPKDITTPGSSYLKTYTALVIPQDMTDEEFFYIYLDGDLFPYRYIPKEGEANLEGGKQYTYDVTVKIGYLEVKMREDSGAWNGDDTPIEVTGKPSSF